MNLRPLSFRPVLSVLAIILLLSACEVGPDYTQPDVTVPQDWATLPSSKAEIDQQWWKSFNDPVLTQLIDKAAAQNFDLKIAEARIAQARASVASAYASLLPSGDIKGTATREANQEALPGGSANPFGKLLLKPYNIYQTGFDASWELDLFGGNRRAEEAEQAQMQASEASRDDVRVSLLAEVARDYIALRGAQAQLLISTQVIGADQKSLDIAHQRFNAGEAPRLDVTQAEATLEQDQTPLSTLRNQIAQMEYSLDVLEGDQPGTTHALVAEPAPIPASDPNIALAAPSAIIAHRPDIRAAERQLAAATAQQGVASAKFYPDISLNGFFGALNTSADNLLKGSSESWLASGGILWPILSYGSLSANLDAANARQQEAMASYQKSVLSALADVERSLSASTEQQKFLASTLNEVEKTKHARAIAEERYRNGLTSRVDVLDADRALYAAQNRLIQAKSDASQNLVAVYKSLGGGWVKG